MGILEIYYKLFDNFDFFVKVAIQILFLILFATMLSKTVKYIIFFIFKYLTKTSNRIDSSIIITLKKPITFFIWLYYFIVSFNLITLNITGDSLKNFLIIKYAVIYLSVLNFLLKTVTRIRKNYIIQKEKRGIILDYAGIDAMEKLSKVVVFIIWSIFALQEVGFNLSALLALGGAGGVLIGFAGKDIFSNVIGGLTIYITKPFAVGDWISSPDREIEGEVEVIDWMQTTITAFDKYPIYVPNSTFGSIVIENRGRIKCFRVKHEIKVRYAGVDNMNKIVADILKMLREHQNINKKYRIYVNFTNFENGLLTLFIAAFTNTIDYAKYFDIQQDILLKIANIVEENGSEIATPTTTLHFFNNNEIKKDSFKSENSIIGTTKDLI